MKTLHVVDSVDPYMGGTARAPLDICAGLLNLGESVYLVSTAGSGQAGLGSGVEYAAIPHRTFPQRFPRHNFRSPQLRRWLRANVGYFDLVEIHGVFSFVPLYAAWACRRSGTPYTVRPHGSLDPYDLQKHAFAKRMLGPIAFRHLLDGAGAVVLTSQMEADRLVALGAAPRKVVAPLPVRPSHHMGDGKAFRNEYRIPREATVVMQLGRIHPKKGMQFLIPSLGELKRCFPNLWLLIVGSGEPNHILELDCLLRKHDMAAWTTMAPFLTGESKQSAFDASDVFALPSLNENFGIAVVEAMYAGVPVVISTEVYIHDIVASGGAGLVCEPTVSGCQAALRALLADEARRRDMSDRGPSVADKHFSPEATLPSTISVYRNVISPPAEVVGRR